MFVSSFEAGRCFLHTGLRHEPRWLLKVTRPAVQPQLRCHGNQPGQQRSSPSCRPVCRWKTSEPEVPQQGRRWRSPVSGSSV